MAVTLQVFSSPELLSKDTALGRELTLEGKGGFVGEHFLHTVLFFLVYPVPRAERGSSRESSGRLWRPTVLVGKLRN